MLDYFDTNFYLKIEISYDYQVIDPQAKKSAQKEEKAAAANVEEHITDESLDIVDYSEKAIAVFGETKACLLYTSPSPRDDDLTRIPSSG